MHFVWPPIRVSRYQEIRSLEASRFLKRGTAWPRLGPLLTLGLASKGGPQFTLLSAAAVSTLMEGKGEAKVQT